MKKIVILGAGESGVGAAILAVTKGYTVFLSDGGSIKDQYKEVLDKHNISYEEGKHTEDKILDADEVIKSPGIPEKNELIKKIRTNGITIIGEIEFAYRYSSNSTIIAITGTNGKSTTTWLTYNYIKNGGYDVAMVGNIGKSYAWQVAIDPKPYYVIEVSSFQLDDCITFKPHIAILTNITPDHLDRYDYKLENYVHSKFSITKNQTQDDYFIYNIDDEITMHNITNYIIHSTQLHISMYRKITRGAFINKDEMYLHAGKEQADMSVHDFALKGKHNQYNTMAAGIASATVGIRKESIRMSMQTTKGLPHRFETVAVIRGVQFVNDSKATNVNSTWYALECMTTPTILILGGVDKGNNYEQIFDLVKEKVKGIVCLGVDNKKIIETLSDKVDFIVETNNIEDCVKEAYQRAVKGDTVLLAPACASFDLFKNFEERGDSFSKAVMNL
jgi:UDP-N-acetylmuramoylalanine--D-glutamate ligase